MQLALWLHFDQGHDQWFEPTMANINGCCNPSLLLLMVAPWKSKAILLFGPRSYSFSHEQAIQHQTPFL